MTDSTNVPALPARLPPLMLTHLALTGDLQQHREWNDRIEAIHQADAVALEHNFEMRRLLLRDAVWKRMRKNAKLATTVNLAIGSAWMALLVPYYATVYNFGWIAALTYLLPVPLAYKAARKMFERASLKGMRDAGSPNISLAKRISLLPAGALRAGAAGFTFGFLLLLFQGFISWFMTPMPTLGLELYFDTLYAVYAGLITGGASMMLAPLVSEPPPSPTGSITGSGTTMGSLPEGR